MIDIGNPKKPNRFPWTKHAVAAALCWSMLAGCGNSHVPVKRSVSQDQYKLLARAVFAETNMLRTDPDSYATILKDVSKRMSGKIYYPRDSKVGIATKEGQSAVNEAINVLQKQKPLRKLEWSDELAALASAHVADTGARGLVSHDSSSGRSFSKRVASVIVHGKFASAAENLSYGYSSGRDVVSQLFIDDGVLDRGHRSNLLKPYLSHTGVACGYHSRYRHMCVAIYASQ